MREIKFRGKRVDTGEWVYGSLVQCDITGKRYILPMGSDANESDKVRHEGCLMLFTFEVIPETIGQHTGLKDKNGKEIYEGDILQTKHSGKTFTGKVYYQAGTWYGACDYLDVFDGYFKCEVIGNIFEDGDLIAKVTTFDGVTVELPEEVE